MTVNSLIERKIDSYNKEETQWQEDTENKNGILDSDCKTVMVTQSRRDLKKKTELCVIEKLRSTFDISSEHSSAFNYTEIGFNQKPDFSICVQPGKKVY